MPRPQNHKSEKVYVYGKNALVEALTHAPHVVKRVHLSPEINDPRLTHAIKSRGIPMQIMDAGEARRKVGEESHQGAIAVIDAGALVVPFAEFMDKLHIGKATALALMAEVQDPHNVGAIIRSAAAFGLSGVLIPEHNQAQVTGTVVKTSAGMAFRIPLISIGNVNDTLRTLKEKGFWVYGLSMEGNPLPKEVFDAPAVFVLGNEGEGIREKTLELCDIPLSIPMHPRCESLNVAVSGGIVFSEWSKQHPHSLRA